MYPNQSRQHQNTTQLQREYLLRLQQQQQSQQNGTGALMSAQQRKQSAQFQHLQQLQQQQQQQLNLSNSSNLSSSNPNPNYPNQQQNMYQNRPALMASNNCFTLLPYKTRKDALRKSVLQKYDIVGYIASGTYGRVYKAKSKNPKNSSGIFAIKKFKADKEGEVVYYTGISQSASREMALCRELNNNNITKLTETILENKCIYMVFEYAEHDLLQIIHFHSHPDTKSIPEQTVKSIMWQVLNGVSYLHQNWVLHRDLKPANIMVTSEGVVKIGDLGLARKFNNPLQSLYNGDKVVVTIWYRAPELLLGGRHYTPAIDLWAVGCILAELLALRPIFKGEEAKMDNKKNVPFQKNQMQKIVEILGTPSKEKWPSLPKYPEYPSLQQFKQFPNNLQAWYQSIGAQKKKGLQLLSSLLEYDPGKRMTAFDALLHPYFLETPLVSQNIFEGQQFKYPLRRIQTDDSDITSSAPSNKRGLNNDHDPLHSRKRQK
ncbi:Serine/threonine-protein kinase [Wickerhamomyces ciferrii]|uniref:Cyclin-dependent kinase 8 n=1 Tax=Wickerhamomyces ciferrii (strain ATCC 14091 / BCRC 22168 / CBS 111 / JCM 3599 / NBRC 0793 / NRRL Y-1031 F-60-10) TaxID=1206466 RepID=K0KFP2_WICCF|nr:Serine/threonine-protein kinase [Wickerhamomyces ciferrii]CCH41052.1 Serine/threonine-protein kinase [Wickerhamomyces ciferrii]